MEVRRRERGREFELDPARAQACETTRHGNEHLRPFPSPSLSPRDLPTLCYITTVWITRRIFGSLEVVGFT